MGKNVDDIIVKQIKMAKYYSISVDSTSDLCHVDQLTFIVRFVQSNGKPIERFIHFLELRGDTAEDMMAVVLEFLSELGLDICNCRGKSYDNARNMSGIYSSLQAQIKNINPLAHFVPCAAHSLNLAGVRSVNSCLQAVSYFGVIQSLYNFFSAFTYRWKKLKHVSAAIGSVVKILFATR